MKNRTLQYYMHDGPAAFRFELAGDLNSEGALRLERDWRLASSVIGDRSLIVDITFVTSSDQDGRELLGRWHRAGAQIIANSKSSMDLAEAALGKPLELPPRVERPSREGTWMPFRTSMSAIRAIASRMTRAEAATQAEITVGSSADARGNSLQIRSFSRGQ
jgi:hypothetical protein